MSLFNLFNKAAPTLKSIYISPSAGDSMVSVNQASAIKNKGLKGDRYYDDKGYWKVIEACQITVISSKDIAQACKRAKHSALAEAIQSGAHRRNLVIDNLNSKHLVGKKFKIGEAIFTFKRQRPPCGYIDQVSQKGMCRSLGKDSGCCVEVVNSGNLKVGDQLIWIET